MLEMAKIQFSASSEVFDNQKNAKKSCLFSGSQCGHCSKIFSLLCLRRHKFHSVLPQRCLIVKRVPKRAAYLVACKVATAQNSFCVLCFRRHKFNSVFPQRCLIAKRMPKRAASLVACKVATAQILFVCYA